MTKAELINAVQDSLSETACRNFGKDDITTVVEATISNIRRAVTEGDEVTLRGFGTFKKKMRKAKTARNISAGTTILVPAHEVVTFKPSKSFTE